MIVTGNRTQRQLISKGWTERNLEGFILARLGFESVGIRFQTDSSESGSVASHSMVTADQVRLAEENLHASSTGSGYAILLISP